MRCWDDINYDQSADYFVNIVASDTDKSPTALPQAEKSVFFKTTSYSYTVNANKFTDDLTTITRNNLIWETLGGSTPVLATDRFEVAEDGADDNVLSYTITLAFTSADADPKTFNAI